MPIVIAYRSPAAPSAMSRGSATCPVDASAGSARGSALRLYDDLTSVLGEDDCDLDEVRATFHFEDAQALRAITPDGQRPETYVRELIRDLVKKKGGSEAA